MTTGEVVFLIILYAMIGAAHGLAVMENSRENTKHLKTTEPTNGEAVFILVFCLLLWPSIWIRNIFLG